MFKEGVPPFDGSAGNPDYAEVVEANMLKVDIPKKVQYNRENDRQETEYERQNQSFDCGG